MDLMKRSSESDEKFSGGTLSYFLSRVPVPISLAWKYSGPSPLSWRSSSSDEVDELESEACWWKYLFWRATTEPMIAITNF